MNKLTPTFLLLAVALILWASASSLSNYLATDLERNEHKKEKQAIVETSDEVKQLKTQLETAPEEETNYLKLADALVIEAEQKSDSQLIMQAVDALNKLLAKSPENPEALFRLAELCLQFGIIDKALDYYPRYLKQRPDDLRARTNYGLSLLQAQNSEEAIKTFEEIIKKDNGNFPAILSLALAYRMTKNYDKAKEVASQALANAPDQLAKDKVKAFLASLEEQPEDSSAETKEEAISPANKIASFFKEHEIIGPKIKKTNWVNAKTYELYLENFPVEQMPPFAKEKLVGRVKEMLKGLGEKYQVLIKDSATNQTLMSIAG